MSAANGSPDIITSCNVNVDTQSLENQDIDYVVVSANLTAQKGPVYVQYAHSRQYSRATDPFITGSQGDFTGMVNNRITIGVSSNLGTPAVVSSQISAGTASVNGGPRVSSLAVR